MKTEDIAKSMYKMQKEGYIKDLDQWFKSFWGFKAIAKSLPGLVRPSDLDCVVEIKGNFLVVEFKDISHNPIHRMSNLDDGGQTILFEALVASGWTLITVVGDPVAATEPKITGITVFSGNFSRSDGKTNSPEKAGRYKKGKVVKDPSLAKLGEIFKEWSDRARNYRLSGFSYKTL